MEKKVAKLKLGFIPTRRGMCGEKAFSKVAAQAQKKAIESFIARYPIELVTIDALNEEGLLYDGFQVEQVVRIMQEAGVEALFAPHCNFGCEEAVAKVASRVNKPLLLWGPAGEVIDEEGYRYRDSQCGLFATSKVLQRFNVAFSYITSCNLEDAVFANGFETFIRAASAVKMVNRARIGQISLRPEPFLCVQINEGELLEQFGIEIVPLTLKDFEARFQQAMTDRAYIRAEREELLRSFSRINFPMEALDRVAALELAILRWSEEAQLDAAATTCWAPMFQTTGLAPCLALSQLSERQFPVSCECDIHGAASSLLLLGASMGESPTFLADITIRHPSLANRELLWHCGVFPKSLHDSNLAPSLEEHYNRKAPAVCHFALKKGAVTLARFDGVQGHYSLLMGEGQVAQGPETLGTYGWIDFQDWPAWEHKLIYGPYIHHCAGAYGNYASALYEACRFLPNLRSDPVEPSEEDIQRKLRG